MKKTKVLSLLLTMFIFNKPALCVFDETGFSHLNPRPTSVSISIRKDPDQLAEEAPGLHAPLQNNSKLPAFTGALMAVVTLAPLYALYTLHNHTVICLEVYLFESLQSVGP